MKARNLWTFILLILIAIGAGSVLWLSPQTLIIPGIVVGVVLLLYFFPPQRFRVRQGRGRSSAYQRSSVSRQAPGAKKASAKKRPVHLRVIEGSKKDDDEEPPLYH
jgi:UPF0716 family protein affecting phage T7 exclusion